jgi:hypothetical protein
MQTVTIGLQFITDKTSSNRSGPATLYEQNQASIVDEAIHHFLSSVVGIATGYGLDDGGGRSSSSSSGKNFHFSMSSSPTLGPTQPPI